MGTVLLTGETGTGPDGKMADFEIQYTFGVEPLQQYLIELDKGRVQALPIAWDVTKKRWFHLYPDEAIPHDDPLHWTRRLQNWNSRCAECHVTNFKKGYDLQSDTYVTTWSEINVSCQSCHGPGEVHVEWAREKKNDKAADYGLVVDFKDNDSRYQIDACARCHSRFHPIGPEYRQGRPLMDDSVPALLTEDLYHADGQILEEVYVYGSFLQSRMYQKGVRCTDCHNPHTAQLFAKGNMLCVRCHQLEPDPRFKTLKPKIYDTGKHHFHKTGSPGAQCVNCHMPSKNYMVVDPRHDHSLRIPRPDLSVKIGTPNACTQCHKDKSPQWAQEQVVQWYGQKERPTHYGEILAGGGMSDMEAGPLLAELAGQTEQSAIIRATAIRLLPQYGLAATEHLLGALQDEEALIRFTALRNLEPFSPELKLISISPLLKDPIRAV